MLLKIFALALAILALRSETDAQALDDPREAFESRPSWLGVYLSPGFNWQSGAYTTDACNCEFTSGDGFAFNFGALWKYQAFKHVDLGVSSGLTVQSLGSAFRERELVGLRRRSNNQEIEPRPLLFRHEAKSTFIGLSLQPFADVSLGRFFFFRAGFDVRALLSTSLRHEKDLLESSTILTTGEEIEVFLDRSDPRVLSDTKALVQDSEFPEVNPLQLGFMPAIGADFPMSKKVMFSPNIQYYLPFTKISNAGEGFTLPGILLSLEFKIKLGE